MTMGFVRNMINRRDMLEKQGYNRKTAAEQVKREVLAADQLRKDKEAQALKEEAKAKADLALVTEKIAKSKFERTRSSINDLKEYRQWFGLANQTAMKRISANQPEKESEIALLFKALNEGDDETARAAEQRLTRSMSPEQYIEYQAALDEFFTTSAGIPQRIKEIYNKTKQKESLNFGTEIPQKILEQYKIKYPNRSEKEIIEAWKAMQK